MLWGSYIEMSLIDSNNAYAKFDVISFGGHGIMVWAKFGDDTDIFHNSKYYAPTTTPFASNVHEQLH